MKITFIRIAFLYFIVQMAFYSCSKLNLDKVPFVGETVVEIDDKTGMVKAMSSFLDIDPAQIIQHGHIWSTTKDPQFPLTTPTEPFGDSTQLGANPTKTTFGSTLKRLDGETGYFVRPYVLTAESKILYGESISFKTPFASYLDMVLVEGGTMKIGSFGSEEKYAEDNELPADDITLSSFYMGRYEITQALWRAITNDNPSNNQNRGVACLKCPVEFVSWNNVQDFLAKLNTKTGRKFRLPTEAEWEFAARGGVKQKLRHLYSGSNDIKAVAWHKNNSGTLDKFQSHEVGLLQPNELGIYDLTGNVIEWCSDWYDPNYYKQGRPKTNPSGPINGVRVQVSGGAFVVPKACRSCSFAEPDDLNFFCRIANRNPFYEPTSRDSRVGFRFVESFK